jgi:hypothetical protein
MLDDGLNIRFTDGLPTLPNLTDHAPSDTQGRGPRAGRVSQGRSPKARRARRGALDVGGACRPQVPDCFVFSRFVSSGLICHKRRWHRRRGEDANDAASSRGAGSNEDSRAPLQPADRGRVTSTGSAGSLCFTGGATHASWAPPRSLRMGVSRLLQY